MFFDMKRKRNYHDSIIKANGLKVIQHINDMGYTLLSEYTGTRFKINLRCPEGHDWSTWWEVLKRGGTCPKCQYLTRSSKSEDEVLLWLQEEGYTVEPQFKLEEYYYDIFIPSHKLLIEYHGLYWHSLDIAEYINSEKGSLKLKKHKHLFKYQVAQNNGLEVIQIWSDLWDNQKEAIKSIILNKLNSPKIKSIYARKCEIKPVSVKEAQIFYKSNHYQGSGSNNIESYGLYYQNQLVMLASISDHHRQSNVKIKVLSRVCTLKYHRVVGGMSRLIKKLPKPLISWSDNLYSSGKSYEKLGFKLVQELPPTINILQVTSV